jgi:hypothetical protein
MNIEQIKETLEEVGFTVHGDNLQALIDELHDHYGSQVVGSSMRYLGDAEPLYVKAGQVAFMVDNELDLVSACIRIRSTLKQREAAQPVVMAKEVRSRYIPDILRALEFEIDLASRVNRPVAVVDDQYAVTSDPATRTQTRKSAHMINDLLADDSERNQKAVKALQALLIHKR